VLYLIYHPFFFTANSLGYQSTSSQSFKPLPLQTSSLANAAIDCMLCEYAIAKNVTVVSSHDEYGGKFYTSPEIDITAAAAILINYTFVALIGLLV